MFRSLKEQVAEQIRQEILSGQLKAGEYLREQDIAERLDISRGPIREAFGILERDGLIVTQPYKGVVVTNLVDDEVMELLIPIRYNIERFALMKMLPTMEESHFSHLQGLVNKMDAFADMGDLLELVDLDVKFHRFIIESSGEPTVMQLWNSIHSRIRLHFTMNGMRYQDLNQIAEEHKALLEALMSRDISVIDPVLKKHLLLE